MNLPSHESIVDALVTEFSGEISSFKGSREECDAIDQLIVKCPRYSTIIIEIIQHESGILHQGAHMLWDAFRLGYQLKCKEMEEEELSRLLKKETNAKP